VAVVVDHVLRRQDGGADELPNLRSLCRAHDNASRSGRIGIAGAEGNCGRRAAMRTGHHGTLATGGPCEVVEMNDREVQSWIELRTCARALAATIRRIETAKPGYYGKHGDLVRRCAAGDDVPLDELQTTMVALRVSAPWWS
jgi:hypothetical protein